MNKEDLEKILFVENTRAFAVLDGAAIPDLRQRLYEMQPTHFCLFRGDRPPDVMEVAPYVVYLSPGAKFADWVLTECFGKHWGIFAHSRHSIKEMRRHFRSLITVYDETGKPMIFRFYDPRVLPNFLPTCGPNELKEFFGTVDAFYAEDVKAQTLWSFKLENDALKQAELK
jgi:hypothetical protein